MQASFRLLACSSWLPAMTPVNAWCIYCMLIDPMALLKFEQGSLGIRQNNVSLMVCAISGSMRNVRHHGQPRTRAKLNVKHSIICPVFCFHAAATAFAH